MKPSARRRPGTSPSFWRSYHNAPIEHRCPLHTEGPFRDCASTQCSRGDRRLRRDEKARCNPFHQRRPDVTVPNGKVTRRNHLSDEPVLRQGGLDL